MWYGVQGMADAKIVVGLLFFFATNHLCFFLHRNNEVHPSYVGPGAEKMWRSQIVELSHGCHRRRLGFWLMKMKEKKYIKY
jgi:hypothetical protein